MTNQTVSIADMDAESRWREWQARGAASDRRTAARMRNLMLVLMAGLIVWFVVQVA